MPTRGDEVSDGVSDGHKPIRGLWVHWIGDFITAAILLATLAVGWGRITTQIEQLKERQSAIEVAGERGRTELKEDVNRRLDTLQRTLERIDDKLDRSALLRNYDARNAK